VQQAAPKPNVVIAALLHKAIKDQDVASEIITSEFGKHVADIVVEVTRR
jgi:(p)ppGpp synthase/HD superfamily hydrolase